MGREDAHQAIKEISLKVTRDIRNGLSSDLLETIAQDSRIPLSLSDLKDLISAPLEFAGLARQQCEAIVTKVLDITTDQVIAAKYLPSTIR
jgi:hypothetical protein